jgi:hypothetical protein
MSQETLLLIKEGYKQKYFLIAVLYAPPLLRLLSSKILYNPFSINKSWT